MSNMTGTWEQDELIAGIDAESNYLTTRREEIKKQMGEKWILHPVHMRGKLDVPLNTLGKSS